MVVHYMSDNEAPCLIDIRDLIENLMNNTAKFRVYEDDIRNELQGRGWYEGMHDCGHFLILNVDKTELQPKAYWR